MIKAFILLNALAAVLVTFLFAPTILSLIDGLAVTNMLERIHAAENIFLAELEDNARELSGLGELILPRDRMFSVVAEVSARGAALKVIEFEVSETEEIFHDGVLFYEMAVNAEYAGATADLIRFARVFEKGVAVHSLELENGRLSVEFFVFGSD